MSHYVVPAQVREFLPTFRRTYRALLREATYLPDSAARSFVHDLVVKRFNPPNPRKLDPRSWGTDYLRSKVDLQKIEKGTKKATKKLHLLERVNLTGSSKDLQQVLLRTYGRSGNRRRELLSQLMRPGEDELPQDDTALSKIIDSQIGKRLDATEDVEVDRATVVSKRQRREHKELTLFLTSQQENNPMESIRGKIRTLKPDIPATNAWGRQLPEVRKATMKRQWWGNLLERVLPPLPEHEWNRLEALATGGQPFEEPPPRRKAAIPYYLNKPDGGAKEMNSRFNSPARLHANLCAETTWKSHLEMPGTSDSTKELNARTMRRMYGMIWSLSSKMVQDEHTREYTITWGGERSPSAAGEITKPSLQDAELFEMPKDGLAEETTDRQYRKMVVRKSKQLTR
ncbi:hypothetical protein NHQ30_002490 [Ciborinia camelliae]|nr:hypothetical protein NHQ30_002490 [Ciborinia camelliae]